MSDTTARDELAREIFIADNSHARREVMETEWAERSGGYQYAFGIADHLIATGWTKPRTITTIEELDALGAGAAVRDKWGVVRMRRMADSLMGAGWTDSGRHPLSSAELADGNEMTVLHEPTTGGAA